MEKPELILGLDIGIGSCGWAILDIANQRIVDMGVHLWDVPQAPKTKQSYAAARREARSTRRNTKRNSDRAKHCLAVLIAHGLVPEGSSKAWLQTIKGDRQPLESRVAALDGLISDRALAQALYNISLRRGYIPHGEGSDDAEGKKVLAALDANERLMAENGWRTVGEMMLKRGQEEGHPCGSSRNHGGDYSKCVRMSQLVAEVEAIFAAQRKFGNAAISDELIKDFISCLTWEKDTSEHDELVYRSVSHCVYYPEDDGIRAAAKACLSFELCNALERVNNVRIVDIKGNEQQLPAGIKQWCIETLFSPSPIKGNKDCKVTYRAIANKLDLSAGFSFKGVQPDKEKTEEVYKPKIWQLERKELSQGLMKKMAEDRQLANDIGSALAYASREDVLRGKLDLLALEASEIDELCKLPFSSKAFSGYGTRSVKALEMLIDQFEDYAAVNSLSDAEIACGLDGKRNSAHAKTEFLPPYKNFDPSNNNPVVQRVMARVRKVVNEIIREYGMPNEIHIELARDLKRSQKEKRMITKGNKAREEKRNTARIFLAEALNCHEEAVPGELIEKKILWDEQEGRDLYEDVNIDIERLVHDSTYCQIDHILPYSRTADNSRENKILVLAKSNQDKKEKSPYEWLEPQGLWDDFEKRIFAMRGKLPYKKVKKLLERNLAEKQNEFIKRNINDTRYATCAAMNYIDSCLVFPDDGRKRHVYAVAGGGTWLLRKAWGFAAKDREKDDCHHALDAAVVAACNASTVIKVAKVSERKHSMEKEERKTLLRGTEPWAGFAEGVNSMVAEVIPTRRVDHGGTARLYEDTVYRFCGMNDKGSKAIIQAAGKTKPSGNYVVREDGSVVLPDGMMMLRLWWNGEKYLKEPVYYSDIAAMKAGLYIPRYHVGNIPRSEWPVVPGAVFEAGKAIELHAGDAVSLGGEFLRFKRINSSDGSLKFSSMRKWNEETAPKNSIGKAKDPDFIKVVNEDILGRCYRR